MLIQVLIPVLANRIWSFFDVARAFRLLIASVLLCATQSWALGDEGVQDDTQTGVQDDTQTVNQLAVIERAVQQAIKKAQNSVVAIARVPRGRQSTNRARLQDLQLDTPLTFGPTASDPDFVPTFFGSGVVLSEDGFVVTCAHVIGDPMQNDYVVWLNDQSYRARPASPSRVARVMAADSFTDLSVLKIEAQNLQPIKFAKVGQVQKGTFVIALGNPDAIARDGHPSASWGIVSNVNRRAPKTDNGEPPSQETIHQYGTLLHTDAQLSVGSSGGALVNLKGEMVGLLTSLTARTGAERSAGFAIAVDALFMRTVEALKAGKLPEFGFLGIQPEELRQHEREMGLSGARVRVVLPGLPGDEAGLLPDDVIAQVGSQRIFNRNELFRELSQAPAGASVLLYVHRESAGSKPIKLQAVLSKKPLTTTGKSYSLFGKRAWRGLQVDYVTAVPTELAAINSWGLEQANIAALSVTPGSAAWESGIRAGNGIVSVAGQKVETPDAFFASLDSQHGPVELAIVRSGGRVVRTVVAPNDSSSQ